MARETHKVPSRGRGVVVPQDAADETERRKQEHLRIPLEKDVQSVPNPWDTVRLRHEALPAIDRDDVILATRFLGHDLAAPVQVTGMTGGAQAAKQVNDRLAAAAAEHGLAMGVGSQRAAIENPELADTYRVILDHDVPLRFANVGLPQVLLWGEDAAARCEAAVEMVEAHGLYVHLNYLQEAVMPEGDTNAAGGLEALQRLVADLSVPVLVKETGAGIDGRTAARLQGAGAAAIDIGGLGGTSFSAVEHHRAAEQGDMVQARMGATYWAWGNLAPECLHSVRERCPDLPVVATGGLRHGLDATKALALGADLAGFAGTMFRAAMADEATAEAGIILEELKTGLFLAGARRPRDLREEPSS